MQLDDLRRHWDELARRDAMWAILTWEGKSGGRWTAEEFFANGRGELRGWLTILRELRRGEPLGELLAELLAGPDEESDARRARGGRVPFRRALDFGCGIGRMVQAMAAFAEHVTGCDISPAMIELARAHCPRGAGAEYVVEADPVLGRFADRSFDLVHSCYVLQHVHPFLARASLAALVRVLAPGGTLLLQVAHDHVWEEAPPGPRTAWDALPVEPARVEAELAAPPEQGPRHSLVYDLHAARPAAAADTRVPIVLEPLGQAKLIAVVHNRGPSPVPAGPSADGAHQWKLATRLFDASGTERGFEQTTVLPFDLPARHHVHLPVLLGAPEHAGRYSVVIDLVDEGAGWLSDPLRLGSWPVSVASRSAPAGPVSHPEMEHFCLPRRVVRETALRLGCRIEAVREDRSAGPEFTSGRYWIRRET